MPEILNCPQCQQPVKVPVFDDGLPLTCPQCRGMVRASLLAEAMAPQSPSRSPADRGTPISPPVESIDAPPFVSGSKLALAIKIFLGLSFVLSVALLIALFMQHRLMSAFLANRGGDPRAIATDLMSVDFFRVQLTRGSMIAAVISGFLFLIWFSRIYANLTPLGATDLRFSSSNWALGCWFVPVVNYFWPYQIAQEIWRNSNPEMVDESEVRNSPVITLWWIVLVFTTLLYYFDRTPTESGLIMAMAATAVGIVDIILTFLVVSSLDARQTARFKVLQGQT